GDTYYNAQWVLNNIGCTSVFTDKLESIES
ncbi:hypothetical protein MGSAQ_002253, partial [marine sediment metagenome]